MPSRELVIEGTLIRRGNGHLTALGRMVLVYVPRVALSGHTFISQKTVSEELELSRPRAAALLREFWDLDILNPKAQGNGAAEALPGGTFEVWTAALREAGLLKSVTWVPGGGALARWNEWAGTVVSESDISTCLTQNQAEVFRQIARVSSEEDQTATLSLDDVAALADIKRPSVQKAVNRLVDLGWLDVIVEPSNKARTYRLVFTEEERLATLKRRDAQHHLEEASRINAEIVGLELERDYHLHEREQALQALETRVDTPSPGSGYPIARQLIPYRQAVDTPDHAQISNRPYRPYRP